MAHLSHLFSLALQNIRPIALLGDINNLGLYKLFYQYTICMVEYIEYRSKRIFSVKVSFFFIQQKYASGMHRRKLVLVPVIDQVMLDRNIEDGKYKMGLMYKRAQYWLHS